MGLGAIRVAVNERLHRIGWDLSRYPDRDNPAALRRATLLKRHDVDLVIDVGANSGQYASEIRDYGYTGHITSFEPTSEAFAYLQAVARRDGNWTARRTAVGDARGELTMHLARNSVSSSALPILDRHLQAEPDSRYVGSEKTPVDRLDDLLETTIGRYSRPFLKIDTQGFEREVLSGAPETLRRVVGIEIELLMEPLYEGATLWREHIENLETAAFRLVGLTPVFWDDKTGEVLALDGLFLRS